MTRTKFPWGTVIKVHTIGTHEITEYEEGPEWGNPGTIEFSINGESFESLDMAILGAICRKAGEPDALPYIARILKME